MWDSGAKELGRSPILLALPPKVQHQMKAIQEMIKQAFSHVDGIDLLQKKHLSDQEGLKLELELIPFRNFSSLWAPPRLATKAEIVDWESWYKWRRLPLESPVALLMTFPMSVYWLLVHVLQVTTPRDGKPDRRKELTVHMLGAECEMNFLPIFSELALLLPYHDRKLIVFGGGVATLAATAKNSPASLVGQASTTVPVFSYTAPEESGASKLSIFINISSPHWTPADAIADVSPFKCNPTRWSPSMLGWLVTRMEACHFMDYSNEDAIWSYGIRRTIM